MRDFAHKLYSPPVLSKQSQRALQEMIDELPPLPPLRERDDEDEYNNDPMPPPQRDKKKGGGNWKAQPKETLTLSQQRQLRERIQSSGLHRTAQQCGVAHRTLTKASKGLPLVKEKIESIRRGLKRKAIPRTTYSKGKNK